MTEESQNLSKELNRINATSGETTSKLVVTNNELAKLEVEIPSLQKSIDDNKLTISQSESDTAASLEKVKLNNSSIDELNKRIAPLEKELEKLGLPEEGVDYEKEIADLGTAINDTENKLMDTTSYISKLQSDLSVAAGRRSELAAALKEAEEDMSSAADEKKSKEQEITKTRQEIAALVSTIDRLTREFAKLGKKVFDIDGERMNLVEARARVQPRESNLATRISENFGERDGFYGKAGSLCKYDNENAYAVEVAAGSRFEYFVVDSIAVAGRIIDYLKKSGLGRATFIPIEEVNFKPIQKESGITPVIEKVEFNSRFSRVFSYIFSDTYIIPSLNDAKRYGIGKHRYVTLEGELAEQSGIVSGGTHKKSLSLLTLESKLKDLDEERANTKKSADAAEESLHEAQKSRALLEQYVGTVSSELKSLTDELAESMKFQSETSQQIGATAESETKMKREMDLKDKEKLEIISSLNNGRQARAALIREGQRCVEEPGEVREVQG